MAGNCAIIWIITFIFIMMSIIQSLNTLNNELSTFARIHAKPEAQLVVVSKTYPETSILEALAAGQTDFGENYIQELVRKAISLKDQPVCWHFIGHIQSNKTRQIAEYSSWVHTLTKIQHAKRLNDQRPENLPVLNVLIEVNISGEINKNGVSSFAEVLELAIGVSTLSRLKLRGLMGVATDTQNTGRIRDQFLQLVEYKEALNARGFAFDQLSMGMSNDYLIALECGATMIRIGSKIFGARNYDN